MKTVKELYTEYERYIFRYLYGMTVNYHVAEELTQETFYRVVRSLHRFRGDSHVTTWLYKIARHVYSEWKRKNALPVLPLEEDTLPVANRDGPQELNRRREENKTMAAIMKELPEHYREVLWLREWQEMSYREIASITGRSEAWVKVNIHRARKAFKEVYLRREGGEK